jgi:hypothetical protein
LARVGGRSVILTVEKFEFFVPGRRLIKIESEFYDMGNQRRIDVGNRHSYTGDRLVQESSHNNLKRGARFFC